MVTNINLDELISILLIFKEEGAILINAEVINSTNTLKISYKKDSGDFEINVKDMI